MRSDRVLVRACLVGAMVGLLTLAGCGKKGPLEPPGATTADPAAATTTPATAAYPAGGAAAPTETAPEPPQHEPFALDVLL